MTISETLSAKRTMDVTNLKSETVSTSDNSFDQVFQKQVGGDKSRKASEAGAKDAAGRHKAAKAGQRAAERDAKPESSAPGAEKADNTDSTDNTAKTDKPADAAKVEATDAEQEVSAGDVSQEAIDSALKELSALLQIPVEDIQAILAALNIQVTDLADHTNMITFMQAVYGTESPAELLNVPHLSQTLSQAEQIIAELTVETPVVDENIPVDSGKAEVETKTVTVKEEVPAAGVKINAAHAETLNVDEEAPAEEDTKQAAIPEPKSDGAQKQRQSDTPGRESTGQRQSNDGHANAAQETHDVSEANVQFAAKVENVQPNQVITRNSPMANLNTQNIVDQIVETMKVEVRGNVSEMRITLKPEHLGDVSMKILTENGIVTAHFVAENQRVKEAIEAGFNSLRDTLREQGLEIANLSVSVGQNQQERLMQEYMQGRQQAAGRISRINGAAVGGATEEAAPEVDVAKALESSVDFSA